MLKFQVVHWVQPYLCFYSVLHLCCILFSPFLCGFLTMLASCRLPFHRRTHCRQGPSSFFHFEPAPHYSWSPWIRFMVLACMIVIDSKASGKNHHGSFLFHLRPCQINHFITVLSWGSLCYPLCHGNSICHSCRHFCSCLD